MSIPPAPVLILGAGVNGICVARELVLNGVPVWLVDTNDIAFGATAKSSRLIHGGLRYLEYGDFRLVAESLHERDRLLRLAPQFVKPLRLHIPVRRRLGGFIAAGFRFLGLSRTWLGQWIGSGGGRGLMTVRLGLWFYDLLARSKMMPRHTVHRTGEGGPTFPVSEYPWSCAYFDAQMERPERFCVALLRDIEDSAKAQGTEFRVMTFHRAVLASRSVGFSPREDHGSEFAWVKTHATEAGCVEIWPVGHRMDPLTPALSPTAESVPKISSPVGEREQDESRSGASPLLPHSTLRLTPSLIINATGAWGDWTLKDLPMQAPQLFGGTKGTHLFTHHAGLTAALGGDAVYAEASDERLVFLIPLDSGVMIGTTDERFDQRPEEARSTEAEVAYLLKLTNELFPQVAISESDIHATCAGIRPLPYSDSSKTAAISRDHQIDRREIGGLPVWTLIGGKLTTCRAFGELVADQVLALLRRTRAVSTRDRVVPGGENHPADQAGLEDELQTLAAATEHSVETCRAVWRLVGSRAKVVLGRVESQSVLEGETAESVAFFSEKGCPFSEKKATMAGPILITGTALPRDFVRAIIREEWVTTLEDLVERRLLLALEPKVAQKTLHDLAALLIEEKASGLPLEAMVETTVQRLRSFYGRRDV